MNKFNILLLALSFSATLNVYAMDDVVQAIKDNPRAVVAVATFGTAYVALELANKAAANAYPETGPDGEFESALHNQRRATITILDGHEHGTIAIEGSYDQRDPRPTLYTEMEAPRDDLKRAFEEQAATNDPALIINWEDTARKERRKAIEQGLIPRKSKSSCFIQ